VLDIRGISVQAFTARSLQVEGSAEFVDIKVQKSADLSDGNFITLDLSGSVWPKDASMLRMQRMSYKYVGAAHDEPQSHEALLKLIGHSAYTADVYSNLETFFSRQGYRGDADRTFMAGKRREREEYFHTAQWFLWLGSLMLDLLVGYGRHPWQAGWFCLAVIGIGCVLFPLKKMELQDPEDRTLPEEDRPRYNRFWYSLGLFLPVVDFKTTEIWGPKKQCRFLRNYLHVHILLGWILVPIFLAAITGLIK
jgi:hypothetical protein